MFKNFTSTFFRKDKGFTLVELMVVMAIVAIITSAVLLNYRVGNERLALYRSANKLVQDIRRVARDEGLKTLQQVGIDLVVAGTTSLKEVIRVTTS